MKNVVYTIGSQLMKRLSPGRYTPITKSDIADLNAVDTLAENVRVLANAIRAHLVGDYLDGPTTLAIGSTKPNVSNVAFEYHINGKEYSKAAVAAGTALSGDDIPLGKYGAWALDIGINGTIDIVEADDNATGYTTAALAAAGLADPAADHIRMGYVTAMLADGAFVPGTTDLDAAGTTVAYTDGEVVADTMSSAVAAIS